MLARDRLVSCMTSRTLINLDILPPQKKQLDKREPLIKTHG